jgi:hypothetical protein
MKYYPIVEIEMVLIQPVRVLLIVINMKIFVSWSGDLSNRIAIILKNWIPNVLHSIDVFVSSEDIDKGSRWSEEIARQLSSSDYGIICLTKDNSKAPWLIFEAGALSNKFGALKVCPCLYGVEVSEIAEPLQQFQAVTFTKQDVFKLIRTINNLCRDNKLDSVRLELVFDAFWEHLSQQITEIKSDLFINAKISDNVKISNDAEIKDIQNTLESFYMPVQNIIKIANKFIKSQNDFTVLAEIRKHKRGYEHQDMSRFERASIYTAEELKLIANYRYKAKEDTCKSFEKFVYEDESEENFLELSTLISRDVDSFQERLNYLRSNLLNQFSNSIE